MNADKTEKNDFELESLQELEPPIVKEKKESPVEKPKQDSKKKNAIDDLLKQKSITFLNDVPLLVTAELSRTKITMKELLGYKKGSIIPLKKLAGEPMDILVNNQFMAKGEVVVVNNNYAVRLTDLIEKMETLYKEFNEGLEI
jgi:flagellar motor switch protein FliN